MTAKILISLGTVGAFKALPWMGCYRITNPNIFDDKVVDLVIKQIDKQISQGVGY